MTPYLVTALHRPRDVDNVLRNWERQRVEADLIVVENGDAVGAFPRGDLGAIRLESAPHQSHAKNAALDWIEERAGRDSCWLTFDADDYYGPDYVSEMVAAIDRGVLIGKASHYVVPDPSRLWLWQDVETPGRVHHYLHGATLAAHSRHGLRFRDTGRAGEDWDLVHRVVSGGGSLWSTSPRGYVWRRDTGDHTAPCPPTGILGMTDRGVTEWTGEGEGWWQGLVDGPVSGGVHRCGPRCAAEHWRERRGSLTLSGHATSDGPGSAGAGVRE